ncbi:hypothetical protein QQF64_033811 [Cirrhinus molitorella]|uniref:DUF4806 domain-containing protein n=1 Tax=Cirrhinus molitorella TaxID=172907 RepID=A0ABR3MUY8_9TELE
MHTDLQTAEEEDEPKSSKKKRKRIVALSVIGGVDVKDTVWRVMKHCLTNPLAKQLNWRGVNGTVRKNTLTATATDQEIELYIKNGFTLQATTMVGDGKERNGGVPKIHVHKGNPPRSTGGQARQREDPQSSVHATSIPAEAEASITKNYSE